MYNSIASSRQEKEREYRNMRKLRQRDNYEQHILVKKRWIDTDLDFFP